VLRVPKRGLCLSRPAVAEPRQQQRAEGGERRTRGSQDREPRDTPLTDGSPGERARDEERRPRDGHVVPVDVHERVQPTPAPRIMRADHDLLDPGWVQQIFSDVNLLVLEGDASALAAHVFTLSGARVTLPDRAHTGAAVTPDPSPGADRAGL